MEYVVEIPEVPIRQVARTVKKKATKKPPAKKTVKKTVKKAPAKKTVKKRSR
jgi:hypothetical protein